jgi:integrase
MKRTELKDGVWVIPAARYKTGKDGNDMVIPLSPAAQEIVASMPDRGPFVFSHDGTRELGNFTIRKAAFDKACGITGDKWTLHDLRRTARSLMSRSETGITSDIAERCLGHTIGGVRGVYDRFEYLDEKRDAFESLAALIGRIIDPPADDVVVPMPVKRRRK